MKQTPTPFTPYQKKVILLISLVQFTIVLDFLIMAPLSDSMMKGLHLSSTQFGYAVSAYAFSAGISGLLAAGFIDRFERTKLLLILYSGFIAGTILCAIAGTYWLLLVARIITGIFGGIVGSLSMAIIADIFPIQSRGRVMGYVQMSLAVSQIAGLPLGVAIATRFGWNAPFAMIGLICLVILFLLGNILQPIANSFHNDRHPAIQLLQTIRKRTYANAYLTTTLLALGSYMLLPFAAPFLINNIHIEPSQLAYIYFITGLGSMVFLPLIGKLSDRISKLTMFYIGSGIALVMMLVYVHLTPIPWWQVCIINTVLYAGVLSRVVPSTALMTAIPNSSDRGAFMSINSSLQQIAGGFASIVAGWIVSRSSSGKIEHFSTLGFICIAFMLICCVTTYFIYKQVQKPMTLDSFEEKLAA